MVNIDCITGEASGDPEDRLMPMMPAQNGSSRGRCGRTASALFAGVGILLIAGCDDKGPRGRIVASVIGPALVGAARTTPTATVPELALRNVTGLGLLRFDESGQLVPGLAVRWAMIDEGPDGIFRIDTASGIATPLTAARLRKALSARDNGWLGQGIDAVVAVTPTVIDVRLAEPRSELPTILAMPALAVLDPGGGPMRIAERAGDAIVLEGQGPPAEPRPPGVILRGERAGRAVARFAAGLSTLVLGGSFADLPVAQAAVLPPRALRFDHPAGLFGLVPADARSVYARRQLIEALSLAIDRDRIVALVGAPALGKATTVAGSRYEIPLADRRARAALLVAQAGTALPVLRIAMPPGPGAAAMFRLIAQDWARVGIRTEAVRSRAEADLVLVDLVAPPGERARAACILAAGCDARDKQALLDPPYIPIATPVRWSLVAPTLDLFTENPLAIHPLDRLRSRR